MARKLGINFDSLLPGKTVTIGNEAIDIKPLSIVTIASVVRQVKALGGLFSEEGVTWENYNTPQSLFSIVTIIMDATPSLMEELTDIDINDIKQLPLEAVVTLFTAVIDVNIQSKEALEKNFESLAGKLGMTPQQENPSQNKE